MNSKNTERIQLVAAILLAAGLIGCLLLALTTKDKQNWNKYLAEHHCQVIGHQAGRYSPQTIYRCDGGVIEVTSTPGR